ncbi:hypothetical protein SRRS_18870 [Sporomusa rhizae]|uniref:methyl-accepting chemotaxis protein n=1 Tax=Sporomusa rhizae TaxID=357999 RepID=UPI00352A2C5C
MRITISTRISIALFVIVVMLVILGTNAFMNSRSFMQDIKGIEAGYNRSVTASQIENQLTSAALDMRRYIVERNDQYKTSFEQRMTKTIEMENQLLQYTTDENKAEVEKLIDGTTKYKDGILNVIIPLLKAQSQADSQAKEEINRKLADNIKSLTELTQSNQKIISDTVGRESKLVKEQVGQAENSSNRASIISLVLMVSAVLLGVILSIILRRVITKPVNALLLELNEIASGNLIDKVNVSLQRSDEFGDIYNGLQKSKAQIRNLLNSVQSQAEQLLAASEQLNANSEQSAQAVTQVAVSTAEIASGAEQQVQAVNSTHVIVERISDEAQNITIQANNAAEKSNNAAQTANNGKRSIESAINQMRNIDGSVTESSVVVTKLGERSKEIGQIIDTIAGIAGQTNLLALNAAIEAARAGEQGRGFAVVAEEVRKLAEQSQDAAKQIGSLIGEIQADTNQAVIAMEKGIRDVKVGAETIDAAGKDFEGIVQIVEEVSIEVQGISGGINELANSNQQIVNSVEQIEVLSKEAASQAQTVSAATEETSASMEEIAASSQALTKMAQEMKKEVSKFKI